MIKNSLINKLPNWYKDLDANKQYLVMSNDFDSYFACKVLMDLFDLEIGGFFEFETGLWLNAERTQGKEPIYVDLCIANGLCFDNHYTFIKNPNAINPNIGISTYNRKYNGSTLALVSALYNYDVDRLNRLTTLLCVDGWYYGYYNKDGKYRDINLYWYEMLGMHDKLLPILKENEQNHFENYIQKHNLNAKIIMKNNELHCNVNIPLPECKYNLALPVHKRKIQKEQLQDIYQKDPASIITSAETFNNLYMISERIH